MAGHRAGQASSNVFAERRFPHDPRSVGDARAFVRAALCADGLDDAVGDALLVVSELAANALEHAGTAFSVTADTALGVRLTVEDAGGGRPEQQSVGAGDVSGRGLAMLAALGRWGVDPLPAGKRVWWESHRRG